MVAQRDPFGELTPEQAGAPIIYATDREGLTLLLAAARVVLERGDTTDPRTAEQLINLAGEARQVLACLRASFALDEQLRDVLGKDGAAITSNATLKQALVGLAIAWEEAAARRREMQMDGATLHLVTMAGVVLQAWRFGPHGPSDQDAGKEAPRG